MLDARLLMWSITQCAAFCEPEGLVIFRLLDKMEFVEYGCFADQRYCCSRVLPQSSPYGDASSLPEGAFWSHPLLLYETSSSTNRGCHPEKKCRRGCRSSRKGARAAILQRIPLFGQRRDKPGAGYTCSLQAMSCVSRALPDLHRVSGNSGNPLQPEPPRIAAARTAARKHEGVRGKVHVDFPPAALRARVDDPSTRESGSLPHLRPSLKKLHIPQADKFRFNPFTST